MDFLGELGTVSVLEIWVLQTRWEDSPFFPFSSIPASSLVSENPSRICSTTSFGQIVGESGWKSSSCSAPMIPPFCNACLALLLRHLFSARALLEKLRGKKLMFVGDSISQNQFLSLICLVSKEFPTTFVPGNNMNNKFISTEYGVSIEFSWAPFLVDLETNNEGKRILHVDEIQNNSVHWIADVLIFESSKWWPEVLGTQRWDMVMEGKQIYTYMKPLVAYRKALTTWAQWVSSNVNPQTLVFFRSTSFSHYNSQRRCDSQKEPIQDPSYDPQPTAHAAILQQVLSTTKFPVKFFNTSHNSAFRKDGHPSMYTTLNISGPEHQDCTHWCLPGVPDSWNQLLYATLLVV